MQQDPIQILHVDDNANFGDLTATYLEKEDDRFSVKTATSAGEGIDIISHRPPDCVISDYDMPEMNGITFLDAVRQEFPDLPFILFTGKGSEKVASDAISADVTDYLQKESGTEQYTILANRVANVVAQVQAEHQVEDERQRFRILFDRLSQPIVEFEFDDEPIVQQINPAFEEMFGYHSAEIVGSPLDEYIVPEEHAVEAAKINHRVQTGERLESVEVTRDTADGTRKFLLQNAAYDDGSYGFAIYTDITDRDNREQELTRNQELLRQTEQLAGTGGWEADAETGELTWTNGTYAIHDIPSDSDFNPTIDAGVRFYHPDDQDKIKGLITRCMENGEPYDVKLRLQTAEDRHRWVQTTGEPVQENGFITAIRGAIQDITKQRVREWTLEELVQRTDDLITATNRPDISQVAVSIASDVIDAPLAGVHLRSEDGHRFEGVAGTDDVREKFEGPPTYARDDGSTASELVCEVFDRGTAFYLADTDNFGALSEETPARSAVVHPLSDHGVFIMSATQRDAFSQTDRNIIELVAQTVTAALDRVEREAELRGNEQRLRRERNRLDEFASVVSHDLRNPLNVATGRIELATQECDSDHLTDATEALSRIDVLIEDLLTLARQGETVGERERIAMTDVVSASWQNVKTGEATITTDGQATLAADRSRLSQALENLFRNALEHGGESVAVTVGVFDDETGFYVADDGQGIAKGEREKVFDNGHTMSSDGTGLGLAITKRICAAHGWDVTTTESNTGGARFEITGVESIE